MAIFFKKMPLFFKKNVIFFSIFEKCVDEKLGDRIFFWAEKSEKNENPLVFFWVFWIFHGRILKWNGVLKKSRNGSFPRKKGTKILAGFLALQPNLVNIFEKNVLRSLQAC